MNSITLNTGAKMPVIGLGTWKSEPGKVGAAVEHALKIGYRHIDCATVYKNEAEIGETFNRVFLDKIIMRDDIFVTSKLWVTKHRRENVFAACKKTLNDLKLDYLDSYLIHWGIAAKSETPGHIGTHEDELLDSNGFIETAKIPIRETWEAMEDLVRQGLVRAIGVANFTAPMLIDIIAYAKIPPAVNQIELHPYLQQTRLVEFCRYNNIAVTAYSSLGTPGNARTKGNEPILLEEEIIKNIADTHNKTPAQILLRWATQRGTIVIPKSVTPERVEENINIFDFLLTSDEMEKIAELERGKRFVDPSEWWKIPYFN